MNMTGYYLVLCNVLTRRIELGAEGWSASQKTQIAHPVVIWSGHSFSDSKEWQVTVA